MPDRDGYQLLEQYNDSCAAGGGGLAVSRSEYPALLAAMRGEYAPGGVRSTPTRLAERKIQIENLRAKRRQAMEGGEG